MWFTKKRKWSLGDLPLGQPKEIEHGHQHLSQAATTSASIYHKVKAAHEGLVLNLAAVISHSVGVVLTKFVFRIFSRSTDQDSESKNIIHLKIWDDLGFFVWETNTDCKIITKTGFYLAFFAVGACINKIDHLFLSVYFPETLPFA